MNIKLQELSLEEKIGQLLVAGFHGKEVSNDIEELIREYHVGNIILFQRNIQDSEQLGELNRNLQTLMEKHNRIPAFISIDQEGGMVARLVTKATHFPGNMALAAGGDYKDAYEFGAAMGQELRNVGVNINFAPVLDINNNPENPVIGVRSYGDSPEKVAEYGKHFFKGLQSEGVIGFGKHFPGHGNTKVDSHLGLPSISSNLEELKKVELVPFIEAINNGIDGIMTAHIIFPEIEKNMVPATLSKTIITGLLREQLGFEGLIVTDSIEMKAIANNYGLEDAVVRALSAGVDLICVSHTKEEQVISFNAIKKAVEEGRLSIQEVDAKVERILSYKEKYDLYNWKNLSGKISDEALEAHGKLASRISENSITLIKDEKELLPIDTEGLITITPVSQVTTIADDELEEINLAKMIHKTIGGEFINYDLKEVNENEIIARAADKKRILFASYNMSLNTSQRSLLDKLIATGKDIILVALRNPYDISGYRDKVSTILCSYEYTRFSVNSVIKILKGEKAAVGKLPVEV